MRRCRSSSVPSGRAATFDSMKATPDQQDADWPRYPETILRFTGDPVFSIDLRSIISPDDLAALSRIGLREPFAVMTGFDPRGRNLPAEENEELSRRLDARLAEMGRQFVRVYACSPAWGDCGVRVATTMP